MSATTVVMLMGPPREERAGGAKIGCLGCGAALAPLAGGIQAGVQTALAGGARFLFMAGADRLVCATCEAGGPRPWLRLVWRLAMSVPRGTGPESQRSVPLTAEPAPSGARERAQNNALSAIFAHVMRGGVASVQITKDAYTYLLADRPVQ